MRRKLVIFAAAVCMMAGCSGRNGHGAEETVPQPAETIAEPAELTVVTGRPGDRWLEMMPYVRVARGQRGNQYGYEVTYEIPGGAAFTVFWSRDQIDFQGDAPGSRRKSMPLGDGDLYYPERLTKTSLPRVYQAIQLIEQGYARDAAGAITAVEAFALIASLGGAVPALRAPAASSWKILGTSWLAYKVQEQSASKRSL